MGWPEMAEKSRNARLPTVAVAAASPARCALSPRPARVADGWQEVRPLVQSSTAHKWPNGPTLCSRFGELFPRVLELKRVFWGLGFHLESQAMFI